MAYYFFSYPLVKPHVLFHGSANRSLFKLQPAMLTHMEGQKDPIICGTPFIAFASIFIIGLDDRFALTGGIDGWESENKKQKINVKLFDYKVVNR